MGEKITWALVAIIYLAILYTLVKPNSKGPQIIYGKDPKTGQPTGVLAVLSDLVRGVTGETFDPNKGWTTGLWASKDFTTHWHRLTY